MKGSPNRKDHREWLQGKAATSQTCSLAQMGSDPPGGPGPSRDSARDTTTRRRSSSGTVITWAQACPSGSTGNRSQAYLGSHLLSQCLRFTESPKDKALRHMLKREPNRSQLCLRSKAQGQRTVQGSLKESKPHLSFSPRGWSGARPPPVPGLHTPSLVQLPAQPHFLLGPATTL